LIIGCGSEFLWARLCQLLELEAERDDPRYRTNRDRVAHREEVRQLLEAKLVARTAAEWCTLLDREGIPAGPINSIAEMLSEEQLQARGFVMELPHASAGALRLLASPLHLSDTPATYRLPPPRLGEHTDQVLGELGYSTDDIAGLRARGAV
jgi:crotonobetainyl-CoA:carnitine CoA-transferase CaiB-like acyl-CoA transferase